MYAINTEKKADYWEVEALFDLCFAPGREALSSYRLRENSNPISELCMLARDKEQILAGAIRYWPVKICLLYTSPSPRDRSLSRMPSSA